MDWTLDAREGMALWACPRRLDFPEGLGPEARAFLEPALAQDAPPRKLLALRRSDVKVFEGGTLLQGLKVLPQSLADGGVELPLNAWVCA